MKHVIMIGCDLHDENMMLMVAVDQGSPERRCYPNHARGRRAMLESLGKMASACGGARVVLAYEASSLGFGLHDEVVDAGMECYVLAPTRIARSSQHRRRKTDEKDARHILDLLRAHVLAGNELPSVWIPDPQTRDDRERVRARLDLGTKRVSVKTQIQSLLKRHKLRKPSTVGESWTRKHRRWLAALAANRESELLHGARVALGTLLRQLAALEEEIGLLDEDLKALATSPRYARPVEALIALKGVARLTALVYLTEMGDLRRFRNRKQIGSFLGLVPSSDESGESNDRKGHITHQGPERVRKVLCQAVWAHVRWDGAGQAAYQRIVARNPKHKKIAVVAMMRRLAVRMWHIGLEAQIAAGSYSGDSAA